jgi:hypothetical protein
MQVAQGRQKRREDVHFVFGPLESMVLGNQFRMLSGRGVYLGIDENSRSPQKHLQRDATRPCLPRAIASPTASPVAVPEDAEIALSTPWTSPPNSDDGIAVVVPLGALCVHDREAPTASRFDRQLVAVLDDGKRVTSHNVRASFSGVAAVSFGRARASGARRVTERWATRSPATQVIVPRGRVRDLGCVAGDVRSAPTGGRVRR